MAKFEITSPDGQKYEVNAPEGATEDDAIAYVQNNMMKESKPKETSNNPLNPAFYNDMSLKNVPKNAGNLVAGALRGAGSIGSTLLTPIDYALGNTKSIGNPERRNAMDSGLRSMGADPNSGLYQAAKFASEFAGTSGIGGMLSKGASAIPQLAKYAPLIESGGFNLGQAATKSGAANLAIRAGAGGLVNGMAGAMIDPNTAKSSAVIGSLIPSGTAMAGGLGKYIGRKTVGNISPEVANLYSKAKDLGVDIPLDRVANSKPLNAVASSLNYIPFSGRAAVESNMENQLNTALSKTFGQNSANVTMALRNANSELGSKFDDVLKNNGVHFDKQFLSDVTNTQNDAAGTLVGDQLLKINKQIDNIVSKTNNGVVDGKAAYNIKKQLDTLSNSNDSEVAKYSRDLRDNLMDALNRSLGKDKAADFAVTRKQWGNMRSLEKIANNGAEGGISIARLANMKHIGNKDLQELADISAQFVKQRESQHGAAQRVFGAGGLLGAGLYGGGLAGAGTGLALGAGLGRATNSMLQSKSLINRTIGSNPQTTGILSKYGLLSLPAVANAQ